jgi:predicted nucleotidyltransferase
MPTAPELLGFVNRWYAEALRQATPVEIEAGLTIRLVPAPCFLATKLEALEDRGQDDYLASRDLEDIVALLDGRPELANELPGASKELKADHFAGTFASSAVTVGKWPGERWG